jgi:drug/metabolite transporter (DMT)-like permease
MLNPRVALLIGLISISIFPVLVKWAPVSGITSAFYRMFIGFLLILPYVFFTRKFSWPAPKDWFLIVLCGIIFASDIAVWNLSITLSNVTQATLLANLSPVWVGVASFLFLPDKPKPAFWIGTFVALAGIGILIGFEQFTRMQLNTGFWLAMLSGVLYASYMLVSKVVLGRVDIISFMTINMAASSIYLLVICVVFKQPLWGFGLPVWGVFFVQGLICQLVGWLALNYAVQKMDAKKVSLSLLSQAVVSGLFAWIFIDEQITLQMIIGGVVILVGIAITYQSKRRPAISKAEEINP